MKMRDIICETETQFKPISELKPEQQKIAIDAFVKLGKAQRGLPERMAVSLKSNPGLFNATGSYTNLAEHLGDLTNRIAVHADTEYYGFETVLEKVNRALNLIKSDTFSFEEKVKENIKNNFEIKKEDNPDLIFKDFLQEFKNSAKAYADAHEALVVYNKAQWHCKNCAISLGRFKYGLLYQHLKILHQHLEQGKPAWDNWASLVIMNDDMILPYR